MRSFWGAAVGWNVLLHHVGQQQCAVCPGGIRIIFRHLIGQGSGFGFGLLAATVIIFGFVYLNQSSLPRGGIIKGLSGFGRLGMLVHIFFINLSLALRTLGLALPIAAQLIVEQIISGEVGPFGVREFLYDLTHMIFVNARAL